MSKNMGSMKGKKILFIGGSLNQSTMMHQISRYWEDCDCYFSPYYADGFIDFLTGRGILDFSVLGGKFKDSSLRYFEENNLKIDYKGLNNDYDLVYLSSDLIVPKNIRNKKVILVQEGMTDPENIFYYLVKYLYLPRWIASTSTTGLSNQYDLFCVASEGYRELFVKKGVVPAKILVTGIPNFDNVEQYKKNNFPHKGYIMVATSDMRETFKYENRKKFIIKAREIADGRQLLFKFHPNENFERATREVEKYAPGSMIFTEGNTNHLIANCEALITRYSSVVYVGMALGKKVYSDFDINFLRKMTPIQNRGTSAERIARIGKALLESSNISTIESMSDPQLQEALNI